MKVLSTGRRAAPGWGVIDEAMAHGRPQSPGSTALHAGYGGRPASCWRATVEAATEQVPATSRGNCPRLADRPRGLGWHGGVNNGQDELIDHLR